jgi:hypothetical protein
MIDERRSAPSPGFLGRRSGGIGRFLRIMDPLAFMLVLFAAWDGRVGGQDRGGFNRLGFGGAAALFDV